MAGDKKRRSRSREKDREEKFRDRRRSRSQSKVGKSLLTCPGEVQYKIQNGSFVAGEGQV